MKLQRHRRRRARRSTILFASLAVVLYGAVTLLSVRRSSVEPHSNCDFDVVEAELAYRLAPEAFHRSYILHATRPLLVRSGGLDMMRWARDKSLSNLAVLNQTYGNALLNLAVQSTAFSGRDVRVQSMVEYITQGAAHNDPFPAAIFERVGAGKKLSEGRRHSTHGSDVLTDIPIPDVFQHDGAFVRPECTGLIIAPQRSGAPFHKHNEKIHVVLYGEKRWIVSQQFPLANRGQKHPGEYFAQYFPSEHERTSRFLSSLGVPDGESTNNGLLRCVQQAGDIIYLPKDWYHSTLSQEDSIALALEYISESNVKYCPCFEDSCDVGCRPRDPDLCSSS
ncbi:hypothetical protein CYMTET_18005 [Cymbomonas tetramitiformis]|uniref:JmjC domain-containing protein n=1 Tax=Cymbomonas tetramitiformis TaxID=36881 RepID=A0AAE0L6Q0_9CHLO|nr:hypothetical protein CYMTET_18005 [Cymbomonas tetramitiformis]